jgi:hypothetical protein
MGTIKGDMPTNNEGQSDIVTRTNNILNKVYSVKRIFHYITFLQIRIKNLVGVFLKS